MRNGTVFLVASSVAACGPSDLPLRRMESDAELQRQDAEAYARSPDVQLPELRKRLLTLGISNGEIRQAKEENDVDIFLITLPDAKFSHLDKRALARLLLDSRYRFELTDPSQIRQFAGYSVEEDRKRRKQRYLRELAANSETDIFPRYRAGSDMTAYARTLEQYCGYQPGGAFNVVDNRWLEYRHAMVDSAVERQRKGQPGMAAFKCIVRIVYATDLQPYFVGNRGRTGDISS